MREDAAVEEATGRSHPDDIVFRNSVGLGIQDAAAAWAVIHAARAKELCR
ncbi:hypothetical protein ACFYPC_05655 [Streptomyces sp. NPDC005808]